MLKADTEATGSLHDHNNQTTTFLLRKLLENESFKRAFINVFADLLNSTFHPDRTIGRVNEMAAVLAPEMPEHINRWRAPTSISAWNSHLQYLRDYASKRPAFARQHIVQKFGLGGTATVTLSVSDTNRGGITINLAPTVASTHAPWTGVYFRDHPLTLRANAKPGFRFTGWQGQGFEGLANPAELRLNGDLALTAFFEPTNGSAIVFHSIKKLSDGNFSLQIEGPPQSTFQLQTSPNLIDWLNFAEIWIGTNGIFEWKDTDGQKIPARFYRLNVP